MLKFKKIKKNSNYEKQSEKRNSSNSTVSL